MIRNSDELIFSFLKTELIFDVYEILMRFSLLIVIFVIGNVISIRVSNELIMYSNCKKKFIISKKKVDLKNALAVLTKNAELDRRHLIVTYGK